MYLTYATVQGIKLCPFTSDMDKGVILDGECMDTMCDAAIMLADVAMHYFDNNMSAARHWLLGDFTRLLTAQTSDPVDTVSLVRFAAIQWCFPVHISEHLCIHGITEGLTEEAIRDATEMSTAVKHVMDTFSPASPPTRSRITSPTLELTTERVKEMLGSPRFVSMDELMG